jgi:L-asparaginase II
MTGHPDMVSGPGRFDTELMRAAGDRLIAKGGAEGFQGVGIPPGGSSLTGGGVGVAVKISDGDSRKRAGAPVVLSVLEQIGAISGDSSEVLAQYRDRSVLNDRGMIVGRGRVVFELSKGADLR